MAQLTVVPKQQEPEISWRSYDRIEPGVYVGYCRAADVYLDSQWKRWVCRTHWTVFDDSRVNKLADLTKFFNLGEGKKPRATSRRSRRRFCAVSRSAWQTHAEVRPATAALHRENQTLEVCRTDLSQRATDGSARASSDSVSIPTLRKVPLKTKEKTDGP
jgi:hypothetical protein